MAVDDSYTKLLLHMDGANNGTTFTDEAGNTVTLNGNIVTKTGQKKFGTASAYCDGSGDYLSFGDLSSLYVGSGKFTFDMWIYPTALDSADRIFLFYGTHYSTSAAGFCVFIRGGKIALYSDGTKFTNGTIAINNWYHVAVVGNGGADGSRTIKVYLNGTLAGTWTYNYNYSKPIYFGTDIVTPSHGLIGYIDEVRVSIGVERWTADFTPPTAAYAPSEPPATTGILFATFI